MLLLAGWGVLAQGQILAPLIDGAAIDNLPQDGVPDEVSDARLNSNVNGNQWRAVHEFDVSSLSGTVLDARLRGRVGPNNSADTGERGHLFEGFGGNGVVDLSDYDAPGVSIGTLSHPSGGRTDFDFDATDALAAAVEGGSGFLAVRTSPMNEPQGFDAVTIDELSVTMLPPGESLATLAPTVDAEGAYDAGPVGVLDGSTSINLFQHPSDVDTRGVLEFPLDSIPNGAVISNAWIDLDFWTYTRTDFDFPEPQFFGYAGDGVATPADVVETSTLIADSQPIRDLGKNRVFLDPAAVQAIKNGGASHLGVLGVGDSNRFQAAFYTTEAPFGDAPSLGITYEAGPAPPQSADYNGDGAIDGADYTVWRDALGTPGDLSADGTGDGAVDGADYQLWREQFGAVPPAIVNGDFETGDVSGWDVVLTPNGTQFEDFPVAEEFDVNGDGETSLAYRTGVGQEMIDFNVPAGAGIGQDFFIDAAGDYELSADVAAINLSTNDNSGPGRFELWFDGELVDVVDMNAGFQGIDAGETRRDTLSADLDGVTAGSHRLEILILRPFTLGSAIYQYLDNIMLTPASASSAVPEPGTLGIALFTATLFAASPRRRRSARR